MFSGATPPAECPSALVGSGKAPRVTPASRPRKALTLRATPETVGYLMTGTRSLLRGAPDGVELSKEGACHHFDYLGLLGGEIFPPATRLRLAVELALALLFLWYVLPGVFLHRARKLGFLHGNLQRRVDALHRLQSICPQVFVSDEDLVSPVCVVGLPGLLYLLHVGACAQPRVSVGVPVWPRRTSLAVPPLLEKASLATRVHTRGNNVPGVPDQEDHTALG